MNRSGPEPSVVHQNHEGMGPAITQGFERIIAWAQWIKLVKASKKKGNIWEKEDSRCVFSIVCLVAFDAATC